MKGPFVVLALLAGAAGAQSYAPPATIAEANRWKASGPWLVQKPGDACSPRNVGLSVSGAASHDAAVASFVKTKGVNLVRAVRLERLDAWTSFDGRDRRVSLTDTRLCGKPAVLFLEIERPRAGGPHNIAAFEVPRATYETWGGAARMMVINGLVPSIEAFPANRRRQIATAPLANQVAFYEAALNKLYENLLVSALASQQTAVLRQMTQLNYNLLFGDDLLTPPR